MKSKFLFLSILGIGLASLSAFVADDDPITALITKLEGYVQNNPQEKVYLHLDKPYYAAGDDIWLKAYLMNASTGVPSTISEILYVDLLNEQSQTKKTLKLPVQGGITWGNISLPDTLAEGNYRLRAYTNYMRNFGEQFFFDKTIKIGNSLNNNVFTKANNTFTTASDKKNQLTSVVSFRDGKNQPFANSVVRYTIKLNGVEQNKGKTKTDENGQATITATGLTAEVFKQGLIVAEITLPNEQTVTKTIPIQATTKSVDVQFLPEGGHLIAGLPCKIGIKAINSLGKGENVKGSIIGQNGTEMLNFETTHLGMGNFVFSSPPNETFKAKIQFSDGSTKEFPLPLVEKSGYSITVNNTDTSKISIRVAMTEDLIGKGSLSLVGSRNGVVYINQKVGTDRQLSILAIPKKELASGIYQFTLFTADAKPVAERITFVNNIGNNIQLQTDGIKANYGAKGVVTTEVVATHLGKPVQGSFSIAVTNNAAIKPDEENESNILTSLLLTSDLSGYVENPNYYFMGGANATSDLDNLLLTQGWRKTDWKMVVSNTLPQLNFKPEKTLSISGRITKGKTPVAGGKVSLVATQGGFFYKDTVADAQGRFVFDNLIFADTTKFIIQARTVKDRKFVTIDVDKLTPMAISPNKNYSDVEVNVSGLLNDYLQQSKKFFNDQIQKGFLNKTIMLDEVKVVQKKNPAPNSSNLNGPGNADAIFTGEDLQAGIPLSMFLSGRIAGITVRDQKAYSMRNGANGGPLAIFVDGMNMGDDYSLDDINVFDVESVEVLKPGFNTSIYGSQGANGIIIITSKRGGSSAYTRYAPGIITYSPGGYSEIKEFYSPKYDTSETLTNDYRTTIYWQPQLVTNAEGKANFTYYNADSPGTYRMVIEGLDLQGNLARKVVTYQVK